jgi:tetratricopeptide (TPR) repeat protein
MQTPTSDRGCLESEVLDLYESARYLDALQRLELHGGLAALVGPSGRALAGRLAGNLGAERLGMAIHLRAWRRTPDANALGFYVGTALSSVRGPVRALHLLEEMAGGDLTLRGRSEVESARAQLFGILRDFGQAEAALARGFEASPERPWLFVVRGTLLRMQDRTEDAMASVREALQRRPMYRPAIQWLASDLIQQNRVDEAKAVLLDAAEQMQCGGVLLQLAALERDLGRAESARRWFDQGLEHLPLRGLDRLARSSLTGMAATLAYDVGDIDEAIRLSMESGHPFAKAVAENMQRDGATGRRIMLEVGFTLQHDVTCVPATLSTLTEFWGRKASHLEIAEAICYDGTPAHAERAWLEEQGFFCREFTHTWDATQALIDAGLPFSQTITGYGSGHMQAVIGYDSLRGTIMYRDPGMRHAGEVLGKELIECMRSSGPRGLVFVPASQQERLEAIDLPDHALWTQVHTISRALAAHQRDDAIACVRAMYATASQHRLTIHAEARIASYDGDFQMLARLTDQLLEAFPHDQNQWSVKLSLLRQLGSRSERLTALEGLCDQAACEIVYRHQLIEELLGDPDELPRVDSMLRRCMRINPLDSQTFGLQARRAWINRDREAALTWSRYAACVDARTEDRWTTYFSAACGLNRSEEAIALLDDRYRRFRASSAGPACSLVDALDQLMQQKRALETLDEALAIRPDDGELLLFGSHYQMRLGQMKEAMALLTRAKGKCHPAAWLTCAAEFARRENRLEESFLHLAEALTMSPLSMATHRSAVDVLADWRGVEAAVEHLTDFVNRYPRSISLRGLLVERSSELGPERAEAAARGHLEVHPDDPWCWRELGFKLVEQRRWGDAREACDQAERLEPRALANHQLSGVIFAGVGDVAEARRELMGAIRLSVDYGSAMTELMRLCDTRSERREALDFVLQELKQQVIQGETLPLFRSHAARAYAADEALAMVREAHAARPDLWPAWFAVVEQLVAMHQLDDALAVAREAIERFPLLPAIRAQLAGVYRELGRAHDDVRELHRALAVNSRDGHILRELAQAHGRRGEIDRQRAALQRACDSEPRDVTHRGAMAEFLWRQGQRREAIETIRTAVKSEPRYEWGWNQLAEWAAIMGRAELPVEIAREVVAIRPTSPEARRQLADLLTRFPERAAECWAEIQESIRLDPRSVDSHELAAVFLAMHGRFDEAIGACAPPQFADRPLVRLQGRAAVIESQRGEIDRAIASMQRLVEADPSYHFGWAQLSTWWEHQGKEEEALSAARHLLEIAPQSATSWGYVADCLARQGKNDECRKHFQRALDLDPSYRFAGERLLELQVEASDFDAALATLTLMGPSLRDHDQAVQEARLHAMARREEESIVALRRAVRNDAPDSGSFEPAVDAMLLAGWAERLKHELATSLGGQEPCPAAVGALVEILSREAAVAEIERVIAALDESGQGWARAVGVYLNALGEAEAHELLDRFVESRAPAIRRHTRTWAVVGSAMYDAGQRSKVIDWMADWPERDDAEPHHLIPLALALAECGQTSSITAVVDHAVAMPLAAATDALRVLGAAAECLLERPEAAIARLAPVAPHNLPPYYGVVDGTVRATANAIAALKDGVRWKDAWHAWRSQAEQHAQTSDALMNLLVARCRLHVVRRQWNPFRLWWALWQDRRARAAGRGRR